LSAELDEQQRRGEAGASNPVHIRLIAPTTPPERSAKIAATAKGFLYYVSREGVTGARETIASSLGEKIAQLRRVSNLPIAVGFGISNADQAREVAQHADAVVVGSAIVDRIAEFGDSPDLIQHVIETVEPLVAAIKSV
jgi:tryptophan synthase alpha chain